MLLHLYVLAQTAPGGSGWLDDANNLANKAVTTGKNASAAAAVIFIILAYVARRTLGAVFAAMIVAGLVLFAVNNTAKLQSKTNNEIGMPAYAVSAGAGGGGGGAL